MKIFTDADAALMTLCNSKPGTSVYYDGPWNRRWLVIRAWRNYFNMTVRVDTAKRYKITLIGWRHLSQEEKVRRMESSNMETPQWIKPPQFDDFCDPNADAPF